MADEQEKDEFDTLGIIKPRFTEEKDLSFVDEVEDMTKHHIAAALALLYFALIVVIMLFQVSNLGLVDFVGGIIALIFIFWAGFLTETFPAYQYLSMTIMFLVFLVFQFLK